jgi:hypothetical protein
MEGRKMEKLKPESKAAGIACEHTKIDSDDNDNGRKVSP